MKYIILVIASLVITHNNNFTSTVSSNIVSELISINNNAYYDSQTGYGSINNQTIQGFEKKFLCQLNVNSNNPNGYKIFVKSNNASHLILAKNYVNDPLDGEQIKYKIHNSNSATPSQEVTSANNHTLILTNEYQLLLNIQNHSNEFLLSNHIIYWSIEDNELEKAFYDKDNFHIDTVSFKIINN